MSRASAGAAITTRRHDVRIRRALIDHLRASFGPAAVIAGELGTLEGRSRVGVACIHDRLDGYEIKSAAAAVGRRLERQVTA